MESRIWAEKYPCPEPLHLTTNERVSTPPGATVPTCSDCSSREIRIPRCKLRIGLAADQVSPPVSLGPGSTDFAGDQGDPVHRQDHVLVRAGYPQSSEWHQQKCNLRTNSLDPI